MRSLRLARAPTGAEALEIQARGNSLRTRWHRAFLLLAAVVVLTGIAAAVGTQELVGTYRTAAVRVERAATTSDQLRDELVSTAILVSDPVTTTQQKAQKLADAAIETKYTAALAGESNGAAVGLLRQSRAQWHALLAETDPLGLPASRAVRGSAVTTLIPGVLLLLDNAGATGRAAVRAELATDTDRDHLALALLTLLELAAVALAVRLAHRLTTELLRPVSVLRDSANSLATGDLDQRIRVDRVDELGELATSFNAMADAVASSQRSLSLEAKTDSLTGLANRAALRARLHDVLAGPDRRAGIGALLFLDLDDFKDVNDSLGHAAGDEVLRIVGGRLPGAVRPGDMVARLGGDEFALLLDGLTDPEVANTLALRVVSAVAEAMTVGENRIRIGASVGIAFCDDDSTLEGLMREADVAMYAAKAKGKNRVEAYDAELDDATMARQLLRADLAVAADRGELVLAYQPVVDLETGALAGMEALVRWQHPTRGLLPPSEFIEAAEETGDILRIGGWVLETAARQLLLWQKVHSAPKLWISVNVSVRQLETPGCAARIQEVLRDVGLDPASLVVEVTESVLADPNGGAAAALTTLRRRGVRVALDDFGTGFSSIGYLRQMPVDVLKIDRSFVAGCRVGAPGNVLLEAIVGMAEHLGLELIPEGIEEEEELLFLRSIGCRLGQGFLLARPSPPEAIDVLLSSPHPFAKFTLAHMQA